MNPICDQVAERVALGEELGDFAEHAAGCARCRRAVALPVELAAGRRDADPGIGFAARMTAGAQHRLVVRRRRRIAVGTAIAVAAAAAIAVVVARPAGDEPSYASVFTSPPLQHQAAEPHEHHKDPWQPHEVDDDVRALVRLANIDRSSHLSASWGRIEKPLAPYRAVIKGTQP